MPGPGRWRGRVALVTGASAGIGAAVAVELVRCGMKVVGCARDVGRIQVCSEVKIQFLQRVT
uniref:Dehydrogenase/reductase SDR family member 11 n=1 Tax=Amphilophus citrinellus TaxID=61819 RepID=A0A3Q0RSA6_AMPCI